MSTECRGHVGAVTITDEVLVPNGVTCTLEGTSVDGDIVVKPGAALYASNIKTTGGVRGDAVKKLVISNSRVGNDIQVNDCEAGGAVVIRSSDIAGNVQLQDNQGSLTVVGNTIGGNLQAKDDSGGGELADNRIAGALECQDNNPPLITRGNVEQNEQVG